MDYSEIVREACVENVDQALQAQQLGADRIELCDRLDLDGLTPPDETIAEAVRLLAIPVKVMIRPRGGDFNYNPDEIAVMLDSIDYCKRQNVSGVVFGAVNDSGDLDMESIGLLADRAAPMEVTIHKAIDQVNDPVDAVSKLKSLPNISAVLTSGKAPTAKEGKEVLREMIQMAGDSLNIIVAGKVKADNIEALHREINAREYHGRKIVG
ncbi:copper homeostasis protein CutC [Fulvivirgaceae bacterium BMA12]|uniref:PF03932 family protein CutC n=1 Tax=Agaribacillus aureus TaxID=3051825 RepID=A0ABT8L8B1_9BACT|nr:copper homeostasis protein CutC [Fulvivirgaceae bacterium BMA12]